MEKLSNQSILQKKTKIVEEKFIETEYYKKYKSLLENERLHKYTYLKEYNVKPQYFIHIMKCKNILNYLIRIIQILLLLQRKKNDVQELLRQSKILITDYSSVYFDFAYMKKPELFYQFDKENLDKSNIRSAQQNINIRNLGEQQKKKMK